jgi:hypothetical protein
MVCVEMTARGSAGSGPAGAGWALRADPESEALGRAVARFGVVLASFPGHLCAAKPPLPPREAPPPQRKGPQMSLTPPTGSCYYLIRLLQYNEVAGVLKRLETLNGDRRREGSCR